MNCRTGVEIKKITTEDAEKAGKRESEKVRK